jgi:hypothetical protein
MLFRLTPFVRATVSAAFIAAVLLPGTIPPVGAEQTQAARAAATLPARLSAEELWKLVTDISEPGGYFRITDNYTSNENQIGQIFTMLREQNKTGGVYIGVGPEQNLTYIAAIKPAMAFIIDIRRQAVMQHLMFKAMFEMSKDRADFVSLLFAKPRPEGLNDTTPIQQMWNAYFAVATDAALAEKTKGRVIDRLSKVHAFTFNDDEKWQLNAVLDAFVQFGPAITTRGSAGRGGGGGNSLGFADLTGWLTDSTGTVRSFLSTEEHFQTVKALHDKNLIIPVSGDFGGPKALRAIGGYVRERGGTVTAFYVSNVEQYLFQDNKQTAFYENVATLPITDASVFIRPYSVQRYGSQASLCGIAGFLKGVQSGRVAIYNDSLSCAQ